MSAYYTKVIPTDPYFLPEDDRLLKTADYLLDVLWAMEVKVNVTEAPVFIDCGGYLEDIRCPLCGASLEFDWWTPLMDQRFVNGGFPDLEIAALPCCGGKSSMDRLDYQAACGFARAEIRLLYPRRQPDGDCLAQAEALLGTPVRTIYSRI